MRFSKISRLVSLSGFSDVSLEAVVEEHETLEDVDRELRNKLSDFVNDERKKEMILHDYIGFKYKYKELKDDIKRIRNWIDSNREKLKEAGFDDLLSDEIPF